MERKLIIENNGEVTEINFDEAYDSRAKLRGYYRKKFYNIPAEKEDIESIVDIGFYKAWKCYDINNGGKFDTFVHSFINYHCLKQYKIKNSGKEEFNRSALRLDYKPVGKNGDTDETTFANSIVSNDYESFIDDIDYKEKLRRLMKVLDERESKIAYYLMQNYSFKEMSSVFGISYQRVQQIWEKAKEKMIITADILYNMEVF